jgi:hypothetical protein
MASAISQRAIEQVALVLSKVLGEEFVETGKHGAKVIRTKGEGRGEKGEGRREKGEWRMENGEWRMENMNRSK